MWLSSAVETDDPFHATLSMVNTPQGGAVLSCNGGKKRGFSSSIPLKHKDYQTQRKTPIRVNSGRSGGAQRNKLDTNTSPPSGEKKKTSYYEATVSTAPSSCQDLSRRGQNLSKTSQKHQRSWLIHDQLCLFLSQWPHPLYITEGLNDSVNVCFINKALKIFHKWF